MEEKSKILSICPGQENHQAIIDYCNRQDIHVAVQQVDSFNQAAEELAASRHDLVITDFQVGQTPVFDRLELLRDIPWIVLTCHGNENIAVQTLKSGAEDYIILDGEESYLPLLAESIRRIVQNQNPGQVNSDEEPITLARSKQLLKEETIQKERVQESLKESREIYRLFFQASSDAAFISSTDGRWIDMNQSALEMFGYRKREEIWTDSVIDVYWEAEDQATFAEQLENLGSVQDHPVRFKRKDGKKIEARVSAAPYVVNGELVGCQGFIRDITSEVKARRVEKALDELSQDLGTSLSPDSIYDSMAKQIRRLFQPDAIQIHKIDVDGIINQAEFFWQTNNWPRNLDRSSYQVSALEEAVLQDVVINHQVVILNGGPVDGLVGRSGQNGRERRGRTYPIDITGSILLAPLVVEGKAIALMQLIDRESDRYQLEDQDLASRISNLVAIGLQKAYLYHESQLLVKKLTSLQRIESVVLENLSLPTTLDMLVDQLVKELGVDAADILYLHPKLKTLKFITQTGFRQNILQHTDLEVGEGLAGKAALTQELVIEETLLSPEVESPRSLEFSTENFHWYAGVPLQAKGRVVGVMELFHRSPLSIDQSWLDLLDMVAGLAAIAIDHQNLHNTLERSRSEISLSLDSILEGWAQALELRGIESPGHWKRTVDLSASLAERVGLEGDDLVDIRRGALMHDIGKMAIPDEVLHKGSRLTEAERKLIGNHPVDAYKLLKPVEGLKSALDIPLYHHERWDGKGYPYQLAGEDIPYHARLFAIVDVWDALLSDRPYRKAFSRDEALTHMKTQSGKHFDPDILDVFLQMLEEIEGMSQNGKQHENEHNHDSSPLAEINPKSETIIKKDVL